jgi:hypothetical protein
MPNSRETREQIKVQDHFIRLDEPAYSNLHYSILYRGKGYGRLELNDTFLRRIIQRGGSSGPLCPIDIRSSLPEEHNPALDGVNADGTITRHASRKREKPVDEMLTPTDFYTLKLIPLRQNIAEAGDDVEHSLSPGWVVELHGDTMLRRVDARLQKHGTSPTADERFRVFSQVMDHSLKTALLHVSLFESFSIRDKLGRTYTNAARVLTLGLGELSISYGKDLVISNRAVRMFLELASHLSSGVSSYIQEDGDFVSLLDTEAFSSYERAASREYRQTFFPEEYEQQKERWKEYLLTRYRLPALQLLFPFFKAVHNTGYELARHPRTPLIRAAKPRILTR